MPGKNIYKSEFIVQHQILIFFILTFLISWTIRFLSPFLSAHNSNAKLVITLIGAYGPALAAIFLSSRTNYAKSDIKSVKRWLAFVVVFLIVNLIWSLSSEKFGSLDPGNLILFFSKQIMAVLVAYITSGIFSSRKAVRDLLLPLINWHVKPLWYCIALLVFPIFIVLGIILAVLLKAPFPSEYYSIQLQPWYRLFPGLLLAYIQTMLFQGPLNEEPGWRGFALPKLKEKYGLIVASIIIGIIWGFWHAPLYFIGLYAGGLKGMLGRLLWTIPLSLIFTWVYKHTHGSLLISVLLHTSINFQGDITSVVLPILLK